MLGWEWQLQSLHAVYKAWSWFWWPVSAIYNFSCPSLTEYLSRKKKSAPYCTRELKNSLKEGHFPDCSRMTLLSVSPSWWHFCGNGLEHPWSSRVGHKSRDLLHSLTNGKEKGHLNSTSDIFNVKFLLYVSERESLYFGVCMCKSALVFL